MRTHHALAAGVGRLPATDGTPVTTIRVLFPDLHGVARGKDVPISEFDHVIENGLGFCAAVMGTDLRHTPVVGGEEGYPDLIVRPDLGTLVSLPWETGVASCLADVEPAPGHGPVADPRGAVKQAVRRLGDLGFEPIVGPEFEFVLVERDPAAPGGIRRRVDQPSMVYTVGPHSDPGGLVREITKSLAELGLEVAAVNHEFMNSQYDINLRHADALTAADSAFRLKTAVKDLAAQRGIVATFMGKPFNDQGGSGTHLHVSLDRDGRNAFDAPGEAHGVARELSAFVAGVLAHAASLMAFLNPTINAYRRLQPDSLAPTHANWGWDNRAAFIRIPPERGGGTRIEVRVGDGAANPYLAIAAVLAAGEHGLRESLTPPPPVSGDAYRAAADVIGAALPKSLDAALDALAADEVLTRALGPGIVETFLALKRFEVERHSAWVSDWDIDEYLHHL
jgi:glutamine synthetase